MVKICFTSKSLLPNYAAWSWLVAVLPLKLTASENLQQEESKVTKLLILNTSVVTEI